MSEWTKATATRVLALALTFGFRAAVLQSAEKPDGPVKAELKTLEADPKGNIAFRNQDSVDDRWKLVDHGPLLSGSISFAGGQAVKGIALRLGEQQEATALFDEESLALCAGWRGEFLKFNSARFGLMNGPVPGPAPVFTTAKEPGWIKGTTKYQGLYLHGQRVTLAYEVNGTAILEAPWMETAGEMFLFTRSLELAAHAQPLTCLVAKSEGKGELKNVDGVRLGTIAAKETALAAAVIAEDAAVAEVQSADGALAVKFAAATKAQRVKILIWTGPINHVKNFAAAVKASPPAENVKQLTAPGPRRWGEPLTTKGKLAPNKGPYVVDTLTLPFDNRYHALFFTSGHDFFADGRAAICTAHGDVWLVSGIDERLENLTWQRFATGLYQPLGLRIVKDQVYVLCRDQIVRLVDYNADGEADFYECFSGANPTSGSGHDYAACLETDTAGNFYFIQSARHTRGGYGQGGVYRVSPDGQQQELLANGLRNAVGLGVGGGDTVTVSPQEGEWTPGSGIFEVKPGRFFGYGGPQVTPERPLGFDPPFLWLARVMDNSSGGQVWSTGERWGPLNNQLIHLSYGRCWPLLVMRDVVDGVKQGAAVKMKLTCESGIMRGRMNPRDGQLYVTGLRGWQTSAAQDGCLQRIRYTGAKSYLPTSWHVQANGITLGFSEPLDKESAEDSGNYDAEQWNYQYRAQYGSPEFKVSDPAALGRDPVPVLSATLLPDGKHVFVELGEMKPVMQLALRIGVRAADGAPVEHEVVGTVHRVPSERGVPGPHARLPGPGELAADLKARLQPGLIARFSRAGPEPQDDCRVERLAALAVPPGTVPAAFLSPAAAEASPFTATFTGFLQVPVNSSYRFAAAGSCECALQINDQQVPLSADEKAAAPIRLHKGYNRVQFTCRAAAGNVAPMARLLWSGNGFAWEPVPPTAFTHDSADPELLSAARLRQGRELYGTLNCYLCHRSPEGLKQARHRMPELEVDPPTLSEAAARLEPDWFFQWVLDPASLRSHTTMPRTVRAGEEANRRSQAADLAAYMATLGAKAAPDPAPRAELAERGEVLFENLGCIACHRFTPPQEKDAADRVSLHFMAAKYIPAALATYISSPHRHHAGSRMPDFHVTTDEAEALAAYVLKNAVGKVEHAPELEHGDANNGRQLFLSLGCKKCHNLGPTLEDELRAAPAAKLAGCLDPKASPSAPDFNFNEEQRAALLAFITTGMGSLANDPPAEFAERAVRRYQCGACHNRDTAEARWPRITVEEGSQGTPPELLPSLTWTGEKLKTRWLEQLFAGELRYRARPWLAARMPSFANGADRLALGLACQHGMEAREPAEKPNAELIELGRQLTLKEKGLDCRQCHGVETLTAKQDNNAQGISFLHMPERVRRGYYDRWVLDPLRIDPGSRMPRFAADGETTTVEHILEGDAAKQFDALWQYIQSVSLQK